MPEVNGEKNRYRNRLSARLRGNESKITRSSHSRGIERRITGAFSHVRRLGNQLAFLVDEHPERHVRLHLLRVQRGRIPERKLLVQHHRQNVRSRPDSGEHITAFCPFAARGEESGGDYSHYYRAFHRHSGNLPLPCATNEPIQKCECLDRSHFLGFHLLQIFNERVWCRPE